jgi:EmrB/QacA subfamily drug resistance transporter
LEITMTTLEPVIRTPQSGADGASRRRWWALALLCVAQFMLILDLTVVNVALPDIASGLGLGRVALTWVVTAYTLAFGGLMLFGGRLADLLGARRVLLTGLALFTAASLMSGLAANASTLLAGRASQGVGAALLSPAALAVLTATFTGTERAKALGVWAAIGGVGSAVGVIVGGVLTSAAGWPWIFYINVPVGIAVLIALPRFVPARPPSDVRSRVPILGALTATAATGAAIYGFTNAGTDGWFAAQTQLPLAAAAVLYVAFAVAQRFARRPLMDVRMLARPSMAAGSLLILVATALLVGSYFLASFYLQRVNGYSALHTGLLFLPAAVAAIVGAHTASRVVTVVDSRLLVFGSLVVAGVGAGVAALWAGSAGIVSGVAIAALGIGAALVTAFTIATAHIDPAEAGIGSAIVNTFHELGGAVGVAVLSSIAVRSLAAGQPGIGGFTRAFVASAVIAFVAAIALAILVPAGRPTAAAMPHGH